VYIFDYPNNTCWVFDENLNLAKEILIDYHHKKGWRKALIVDKGQGEVYTAFEKNGLSYLKKIDLTTGKIIKSYQLEKHTYPTKIKIKNNTAYYLYKDHFNHGQMSLFKQGLY
jgi:glutamine cyclotransferase